MHYENSTSFRPPGGAGLRGALRHVLYRLSERFCDWRYGIFSDAEVKTAQFGIVDPTCFHYTPISYVRFGQLMRHVRVRPGEDVFMDYGSGMGRAVVLAATYPFRQVIGVELSPQLDAVARENVRRARPRLRCRDLTLHVADARTFPVPAAATVFFFWNPFGPEVLASVFARIHGSLLAAPREVTILYVAPRGETALDRVPAMPWLERRPPLNLGAQSQAIICTGRLPRADGAGEEGVVSGGRIG